MWNKFADSELINTVNVENITRILLLFHTKIPNVFRVNSNDLCTFRAF